LRPDQRSNIVEDALGGNGLSPSIGIYHLQATFIDGIPDGIASSALLKFPLHQ
jgi:hypothetical protein